MEPQEISFKEYVKNFLRQPPDGFTYQDSRIQVYDLFLLSKYLVFPTPLLKAQFSFMVHLTHGHFEQRVGSEIKKVFPSSVLLVAHGEVTSLIKASRNVKGFFILFENSVLNQLPPNDDFMKLFFANSVISLGREDNDWAINLTKLLQLELRRSNTNHSAISHLFYALLHKVLSSSKSGKIFAKQYETTVKFRHLAYKYFENNRNVSFYANKLNVSENYLNRCVRKILGKSTKEVLLEVTIIQSQIYLQNFTKSISEVAYQLNFRDPSYFARLFKRNIGITPADYRKNIRTISPMKSRKTSAQK